MYLIPNLYSISFVIILKISFKCIFSPFRTLTRFFSKYFGLSAKIFQKLWVHFTWNFHESFLSFNIVQWAEQNFNLTFNFFSVRLDIFKFSTFFVRWVWRSCTGKILFNSKICQAHCTELSFTNLSWKFQYLSQSG